MVLFSGICKSFTQVDGRVYVITGANSGIGLEAAGDLGRCGATIIMAGRSMQRLEEGKAELLRRYGPESGEEGLKLNAKTPSATAAFKHITPAQLILEQLDLASFSSIREFASRITAQYPKINVLINNAGVMHCPFGKTADGFETQIGTNFIGHFLLTNLLLPALEASAAAGEDTRIINVSSLAHTQGVYEPAETMIKAYNSPTDYSKFAAYSQSKLANVTHACELAKRLKSKNIMCVSLHPGVIRTELSRHYSDSFVKIAYFMGKPFTKSPWLGAQTTLHCAFATDLTQGGYYSDCVLKAPTATATNEDNMTNLWIVTAKLIEEADKRKTMENQNNDGAMGTAEKPTTEKPNAEKPTAEEPTAEPTSEEHNS